MSVSCLSWLNELKFESGLHEGPWTYMPVSTTFTSAVDYLTLNEGVERELATISEVNFAGSVPQMQVTNNSPRPLFIPDGMTLVGCKQNRVVNVSILIPAYSKTMIPVSCVEAGRWHMESAVSQPADLCDPELRSAMSEQSLASLCSTGSVTVNQGKVWQHVGEKLRAVGVHSPTASYQAVFNSQTARRRQPVPYREGTCGIVVFYQGRICSFDVFDKASTLKTFWSQIVRSTVALDSQNSEWVGELEDPKHFVAETLRHHQGDFPSIGRGTNCRFRSSVSVGSALVVDTQPLHVAMFRRQQTLAAPTTDTKPNNTTPNQPARWKFWKR